MSFLTRAIELGNASMSISEEGMGSFIKSASESDVTINDMTQQAVRHGEILRFGAVAFENRALNLSIASGENNADCYFSYLELYPRLGQKGFTSVEVRGVEAIRINEIMVKPRIMKNIFSGQKPGGDWSLEGNYYRNYEPNGGKRGEGAWIWKDVKDGNYYVR